MQEWNRMKPLSQSSTMAAFILTQPIWFTLSAGQGYFLQAHMPLPFVRIGNVLQRGDVMGRWTSGCWLVDAGHFWLLYSWKCPHQRNIKAKIQSLREEGRKRERALTYSLQDTFLEQSILIKEDPQNIVIFFGYEDNTGDHIFFFTKPSFFGQVYPYFSFYA